MKKQDNESLIQELTKRLDWYIMEASDEEFDADEVQTLMKLLDNLKTEEDNVEDELPVEEALDDFWKHCEEREEEERLLLGTEEEKDKSEPVAEKEEDKPRKGKHGGFFWWMDKNEEGTTMITAPEGNSGDSEKSSVMRYYNIDEIPEEYREYVYETFKLETISEYTFDYVQVRKDKHDDNISIFLNNKESVIRFQIKRYPQEL